MLLLRKILVLGPEDLASFRDRLISSSTEVQKKQWGEEAYNADSWFHPQRFLLTYGLASYLTP